MALIAGRFLITLVLIVLGPAKQEPGGAGNPDLCRAYYLEQAQKDYSAARAIYDRIAADPKIVEGDRNEAARRAARCRDALAAENFASLMPPDPMVYVELHRPLGLVRSLAGMLGLSGDDMRAALASRAEDESALPWSLPTKIMISPALLDALESFGGAALALTDLADDESPRGVAVVHHGDVALLRGLIETAFQFSPTTKKIAGLPTFRVPGHAVGVLTDSLLIVGTSRKLVQDVVTRLERPDTPSLASRKDLAEVHARRQGATLFAYVDGPACVRQARARVGEDKRQRDEFAQADALLDLDHLRWATLSFSAHGGRIGLDLAVRLADDHRNLVYNLLRTPPMTRRSMVFVPAGAAAVFGLGLNPPRAGATPSQAQGGDIPIAGLDVFRELFGNVEEMTVFVIPGGGTALRSEHGKRSGQPLPNAGIVIAAADARKSAALWDLLLSVPSRFMRKELGEPKTVEIAGATCRAYELPDVGTVYAAEREGCLVVGLTRTAIREALGAQKNGRSILKDETMRPALEALPADATLMILAHGGRCAALGAEMAPMARRVPMNVAANAMKNTLVWIGLGESPAQFQFRAGLTGLPDVNELVQKFSPMMNLFANRSTQGDDDSPARPAPRPRKPKARPSRHEDF